MATEKDNDQITETTTGDLDEIRSELEKVKAKNKELIAEKQKHKQKAQEAQDAADEAATQAAERNGDIEALKAAHQRELAKLQAKLDTYDSDLRTIRVDNEITRALTDHNVLPEHADVVTAFLKSRVQYDNGVATVDGVPLADHINTFLTSNAGAHYRRAASNSGGGATGNTSTFAPPPLKGRPRTPAEFDILDRMPNDERNAFLDSIGAPDLKV